MKSFYKTLLLLFLASPLLILNSFSQQAPPGIEWAKCYGGNSQDGANAIVQTNDGNFVIAGGTQTLNNGDVSGNHGQGDFWIVKIDTGGNILWQKCFGGSIYEEAYSIVQTKDGGFAIAGKTESNDGDVSGNHLISGFPYWDYWVVKTDSVGNIEWQKCLGGQGMDCASSIVQSFDGGYAVAGGSFSNDGDVSGHHGSLDTCDYWVVKLDSVGNILWQKSLGGTGWDWATIIIQTRDSGYIVGGSSNPNWLFKLDNDGNIQWQKSPPIQLGVNAANHGIIETIDGNIILTGSRYWTYCNNLSGNHGGDEVSIIKLDSVGNSSWQTCYGGSSLDIGNSIYQTNDGGYVLAGITASDDGDISGYHNGYDYWIVKTDSIGTMQWQKCLGGFGNELSYQIMQINNGGYLVGGWTFSTNGDVIGNHGNSDFWIIKLAPDTITSIPTINQQSSIFTISPNPSNGIFQITFSSKQKTNNIEIINTLGQTVFQSSNNYHQSSINLDLSFLPKGIYFLKMSGGESASAKTLIIQ
jgi:hypothetical protein